MCGIGGVYNRATGTSVPVALLDGMVGLLRHRGPDQTGTWSGGQVGFAHTRLKIIDLTGGRQPMSDPRGRVTLVYNGELWNYRPLRAMLRARGHVFIQESDTEVLLHAYLEFGEDCFRHLDGMFAVAIWDARREQLILARDRAGKKPLYYAEVGGDLVFGSEIKALFCDSRLRRELDAQALTDLLVLRYVPAPATLFAGIRKLPPATVMVADAHGLRHVTYREPLLPRTPTPTDERALMRQVREAVRGAVERRLMSDVPLGVLLSGGVDSSIIVAEASRLVDEPLKTFSVGFTDAPPSFDERPYARWVAETFRTEHHEIVVGERDFVGALPLVAWQRDEPVVEASEVPTYFICRAAKEHATVLLSGEGGDEVFGGYPIHAYQWLTDCLNPLPSWFRRRAQRGLAQLPPRGRRLKILGRNLLEPDEARRWAYWGGAFTEADLIGLLSPGLAKLARARPAIRHIRDRLREIAAVDALDRALYLDTAIWLPDNLLMRDDKMSMAASVEVRMPFLDCRLVELVASIPARRRVRPFAPKSLLKEAYAGILPRAFLHRRKVGFAVPIGLWFRSPRFGLPRTLLTGERARARGLFRPEAVDHLLREHCAGRANHHRELFTLLAIELWHRVYIDASFAAAPRWDDILAPSERPRGAASDRW